jgi:hypothetical protein
MLNRNLWMIWPTGYYGSYVHWLICKCEKDLSKNTVDSPFFNNGSSHAHIKNPPHHTIEFQIQSILRNRYPTGTIYPIGVKSNVTFNSANNNWMKSFENTIFWILRTEIDDPVIINIHNHDNIYQTKLAAINVYHKEHWIVTEFPDDSGYKPFSDSNTLRARNYLVDTWKSFYPYQNKQLSVETIDQFRDAYNNGNLLRHQIESYEYNKADNWISATGKHLYNIKLDEILSDNFIDILSSIMDDAQIGDFDWKKCGNIHEEFLERQKNYIQIANNLYVQAQDLIYYPDLDDNILYSALAIDTLHEQNGYLPDDWQLLSLRQIVESYDKQK